MLARCIFQGVIVVLSCFIGAFIPTAKHWSASEEVPEETIDKLISDLMSDRFESREAATRMLKERVEATSALLKVRHSADPEVRRRVEDILTALERKRVLRGLGQAKALGQAGRAVEVADRLAFAAKCGVRGEEGWESLTQFADQVITRTNRYFSPKWRFHLDREFPAGDFRRYTKLVNPKEIAERKIEIDTGKERDNPHDVKERAWYKFMRETRCKLLLRGEEIAVMGKVLIYGINDGMIASSGDVHITGAANSVIVAGGDINQITELIDCVIICDGDVELMAPPRGGNLILARGRVTWKNGQLKNGQLRYNAVRSGHTLFLPNGKSIELKDGMPDPFSFAKFFELADVGLSAEDLPPREKLDAKGVRLKDVRKDSPFTSGLRAGDVIIAVEQKQTPTTEIFRRVLRRKLAEGEPILTFTVRRSGKTLDVPIAMKD